MLVSKVLKFDSSPLLPPNYKTKTLKMEYIGLTGGRKWKLSLPMFVETITSSTYGICNTGHYLKIKSRW